MGVAGLPLLTDFKRAENGIISHFMLGRAPAAPVGTSSKENEGEKQFPTNRSSALIGFTWEEHCGSTC